MVGATLSEAMSWLSAYESLADGTGAGGGLAGGGRGGSTTEFLSNESSVFRLGAVGGAFVAAAGLAYCSDICPRLGLGGTRPVALAGGDDDEDDDEDDMARADGRGGAPLRLRAVTRGRFGVACARRKMVAEYTEKSAAE